MILNAFKDIKQVIFILYSMTIDFCLYSTFIAFSDDINKSIHYLDFNPIIVLAVFEGAGISRIFGSLIYSSLENSQEHNRIFYIATLILSLTNIIYACLPSIKYLVIVSVAIFAITRILNGMLMGAIIPKAIVFNYMKASHPSTRILATCFIHVAEAIGFIFTLILSIICNKFFGSFDWHIAMLIAGILGIIISFQLKSTFSNNVKNTKLAINFNPLKIALTTHKMAIFRLICFASFLSTGLSVFFYVMPNFLLQESGYQANAYKTASIFLIISFAIGVMIAVKFDKWLGKKFYLISGIIFKSWLAYVFSRFTKSDLLHITFLCSICTLVFGIYFAKLPVMVVSSFPKTIRYIGVAIVYNIGFGLMFALSPKIISFIEKITHYSLSAPTGYVIFFSYVSIISLWFMPKQIFKINTYKYYNSSDNQIAIEKP